MPETATHIEPLDLFGLGRMWWQGHILRECLTDQARFDCGDRMEVAIELGASGCHNSRLGIDVSQDAAGRWWAGYFWRCWHMPDGTAHGTSTPIDAFRAATREEAIRLAATGLLQNLPNITTGKGGRILSTWRRELAARIESERRAA
ncbi:hypothetical protein [Sediminicoccus sp. KRV36]|uniref:hypothetical protein n=1 Tax=Sediminicoccus sp. KRV36 TaxID=3133721 RepID=UPI0020107048|nr:hypothetical protein [Sediminicoccus rosea]UPY35529.1 hypothetical protein LHU95_15020 [Sediminicoccus rosea]